MAPDEGWFPEGYSPGISTEEWLELLHDKDVCKEGSLILLKCLKDSGGAASCKQLSRKYGRHAQAYNRAGSRLAERVARKTDCPVLQRENGKPRWWPVIFLGRFADAPKKDGYIWKLRPELAEALEHSDLSAIPLYENAGMNQMPVMNENAEITDEYRRAAKMLLAVAEENAIDIEAIAHEAEEERRTFVERFSPEKLLAIPDDNLLAALYLTQPSTKDYMMYHLEAKTESWGSIWGGSSHKFGLFQRAKDHRWVNASGQELTEADALAHAKDVREKLVQGSHLFENLNLSHREEIENLDAALQGIFGNSFAYIWMRKYFALLYPHKLSGFYSPDWQNYVLSTCRIPPMATPWARSAQIARISQQNGWQYPEFYQVFVSRFGKPPKEDNPEPVFKKKVNFQLPFSSHFPKNRIIFGAPGTGKSHKLKQDSGPYFGPNIERVTFHPDYAYSHFMGCYKPQTTREGNIRYGFVPGPFLRVLVRALRSGMEGNPQPHLLLIEELNRARVAAVFGDAFQLLDRADEGYSEYDIAVSEDVKEYLSRELGCAPGECERIRIPGNMFIWATMNSADQGVFPMDTAFKRRWSFEYLPIDPANPPDVLLPLNIGGNRVTISWNKLRGAINDSLSALRINEDKLIGPYFLKPSVLEVGENGIIKNIEGFNDVFKNKILMYLFEDAARQRRPELFKGCADHHRYSALCREYDERGLAIFGEDFVKTFSKNPS
ncbi:MULTISPECIES: AAA family ATPase [unclassified Desulfovibrio]|uniref:McrB family protein n=1 Tax=unclassified Desulfovibrio TaxID=2593640 RepID=UPI0013EDA422|nr:MULTISPECIES: AAA family ATPase [unclassified Desulfovibrio]